MSDQSNPLPAIEQHGDRFHVFATVDGKRRKIAECKTLDAAGRVITLRAAQLAENAAAFAARIAESYRLDSAQQEIDSRLEDGNEPVSHLYGGTWTSDAPGCGNTEHGIAVWSDGFRAEWRWSGDARRPYEYHAI